MNIDKGKQILDWNPEVVDHGSYKDLGHYAIDMGEVSQKDFADGAVRANAKRCRFRGFIPWHDGKCFYWCI